MTPDPTPMTDEELAEIRESSEWAISANNALRLLAEVDRLRTLLAEMMNRPGVLAMQLAEIGGMVGYPDPSGIVDAVRSELQRLRAELAEARASVAYASAILSGDAQWEAATALKQARRERDAALARIEAAREHHEKAIHWPSGNREPGPQDEVCLNCHDSWPCLTVRALDAPSGMPRPPAVATAERPGGTALPASHTEKSRPRTAHPSPSEDSTNDSDL